MRLELNTLLSVLVKQNGSTVKATHHIEILQKVLLTRNPPYGLKPKINPRIPDNKQVVFIIEWSYMKLLVEHSESVLSTSTENINSIKSRIEKQ